MAAYILRRLLLMIPTIFGIMLISFVIVQFAPGGPVERIIAQLQGHGYRRDARVIGRRRRLRRRRSRSPAAAAASRRRAIAARRASIRNSSSSSRSSSASTSRRTSASAR